MLNTSKHAINSMCSILNISLIPLCINFLFCFQFKNLKSRHSFKSTINYLRFYIKHELSQVHTESAHLVEAFSISAAYINSYKLTNIYLFILRKHSNPQPNPLISNGYKINVSLYNMLIEPLGFKLHLNSCFYCQLR